MTGTAFRIWRERMDLTQRELADRWDLSHMTIHRREQREEVGGLYEEAMRRLIEMHRNDEAR